MSGPKPYIRPGFVMTHLVNPIARRLGPVTTLTVVGRTSGQPRAVPLGEPFEYDGRRYHDRTERIRVEEVEGPERAKIVAAYRKSIGRSAEPYFREIPDPADHPTFLIDRAESETS
jgi:hypothetical protein